LAGDAGISASNSKDIAVAILTIAKNRKEYQEKARKRAEWFADRSRPWRYINKLVKNAKQARNAVVAKNGQNDDDTQKAITVASSSTAGSGPEEQSDLRGENKYNPSLFGADISDDGHSLFVRRTNLSYNITRK
jgi:hypothetical protein